MRPAIGVVNRFSFPQKFMLFGLIYAVPFVVLCGLQLRAAWRDHELQVHHQTGLEQLEPVMESLRVAEELGVHEVARGVGDRRRDERIAQLETELDQCRREVDQLFAKLPEGSHARSHWEDRRGRTESTASARVSLDPERITAEFHRLNDDRARLIVLLADEFRILDSAEGDPWLLLSYIESLPQLTRSMTAILMELTIVAGRSEFERSAQRRVRVLRDEVEHDARILLTTRLPLARSRTSSAAIAETISKYEEEMKSVVDGFLEFVDRVLDAPAPEVSTLEVSDHFHDVRFAVFGFFESIGPALIEQEAEQARTTRESMVFVVGLGVGAAILLLYLFSALSIAVRDSVRSIRGFTERMIGGTTEEFHSASRDELGQVVHSYNQINEVLLESRELRLRIEEQKTIAERASRAKSEFLATMSHELRTPMNAIMGVNDLLGESDLTGEQRDLVEMSQSSSRSLLALISDMLDFSSVEAGRIALDSRPLSLRSLVAASVDPFAAEAAAKEIELHYAIDRGVPDALVADETRLGQVFALLLSNAIKFTVEGEIELSVSLARVQPGDGAVRIRFQVDDTGLGIPLEKQDQLFQTFQQIDRSSTRAFGGVGLGLAIGKGLVELMGGSIGAESSVGVGSRFFFEVDLPLTPPDRVPDAQKQEMESLESDHGLVGRSLLVIEWSETRRDRLLSLAAAWNMNVRSVHGVVAAQEMIAGGFVPDAVCLLEEMCGGESEEVVRELRSAAQRPVPFVLLVRPKSGTNPPGIERSERLQVPVRPLRLGMALRSLIETAESDRRGRSPAASDRRPVPSESSEKAVPSREEPGSLRVLVAEDNPANQRLVLHFLKKLQIDDPVFVENGALAVEAVMQDEFDLVLMDVHMPVMDGLEATRSIRERCGERGPYLIAVTANVHEGAEAECREAGMDDYVPKPVRLDVLESAMSTARDRLARA